MQVLLRNYFSLMVMKLMSEVINTMKLVRVSVGCA